MTFFVHISFSLNYLSSSLIFANRPFHFKIFGTLKIFEDLRRFLFTPKILCISLRSIFRIQRIFVFIFGPFSIFVATLLTSNVNWSLNRLKIPWSTLHQSMYWKVLQSSCSIFKCFNDWAFRRAVFVHIECN